jgi:hypothetical protein
MLTAFSISSTPMKHTAFLQHAEEANAEERSKSKYGKWNHPKYSQLRREGAW